MLKDYRLRNYNFKLVFLVLALSIYGTVIIYSADHSYLNKQIFGVVTCFLGMLILSLIDYRKICKLAIPLYIINIILLLLIFFVGTKTNGATRWFRVSDTMTIQPSEFTKVFMVICLAVVLGKMGDAMNRPKNLGLIALTCAIPLFLIYEQPDLSTTLDITMILFVMIFVAGLSYKIIGIALLIMIPLAGGFVWYVQTPNQKLLTANQLGRVMAFLYPQDYSQTRYQQDNSIMAIGSGMLSGKGLNESTFATVKDANYISEQQTDFIFSVVGEELGFIGCVTLVALIALLVFEIIHVARKAADREGMLIATGVAAWIGIQSFFNMGVATGVLPNTGIPLPFISYGLSSLVSSCAGVGLVLNIALQRKQY